MSSTIRKTMTSTLEQALDETVGGRAVRDHLAAAVAAGRLIAHGDGTWELPAMPATAPGPWLPSGPSGPFPCRPLFRFLFQIAYGRARVPWGCRNCYKVKLRPRRFRELMAAKEVLGGLPHPGKCGVELGMHQSSGVYAGFLYFDGLDAARAGYHQLRARVDAHPRLGPEVPLLIKRGCTEYEMACGPSDGYRFAPGQEATERELVQRLRPEPGPPRFSAALTVMGWAQTAFRIGDETYLDFTGGRRLYPSVVTYDPGPPPIPSKD